MRRLTGFIVLSLVGCAQEGTVLPDGNHLPEVRSFACTPEAGAAPLLTTCSWQIRDVDGERIQCKLDVDADGSFEKTIEDCFDGSEAFTVLRGGTNWVRLTLTDWRGATASADVSLNVDAPPNADPKVLSFDATPATGGTPVLATFAFAVGDEDSDPLTCRLLENGQALVGPNSCSFNETWTATLTQIGTHLITLEVSDGKGGKATRQASVVVTALPQVGDLRVSKVEWGQSVISATPRLIANKDALLRVFVVSERAGIAGVVVKVTGTQSGTNGNLGELTLTGPATAPTAEVPADMNQQWRVTVPATWIIPGLQLKVRVDPDNTMGETNEMNNELAINPNVGVGNVFVMTNVPIVQSGGTGTPRSLDQSMKQVWPIARVAAKTRAAYTFSGTIQANGTGWGPLLDQLAQIRQQDGSRRTYLGWIRATFGSGVAGLAYLGIGVALTRDDTISTAIHELGHTMNREHAPCGGAGGADPSYPVANARLDTPGYDFVSGRMLVATQSYDVMSYCDPVWISNYNYKGAQQWLESRPVPETAAFISSPRIIVSGRLSAGKVILNPINFIDGPAEPEAIAPGEYLLTLRGDKTVSVPFSMNRVEDGLEEAHFTMVLPPVAGLYAAEVSHQGKVFALRVAGPQQPRQRAAVRPVQGGVELTWDAAAFPYASLAHMGENERTTLTLFAEGGKAFVSTDGLVDGGAWEVSLSDGVQSQNLSVAR